MVRKLIALSVVSIGVCTSAANLWAAEACGVMNQAVATTVPEARLQSLFLFTVEATSGTGDLKDNSKRSLIFLGNAFLIDVLENVESRVGFFATAKHNLAAACTEAKKLGDAPPRVRLVGTDGESVAANAPTMEQCRGLLKIAEAAGTADVVFNPDLSVLSGQLPFSAPWKPILLGSFEAANLNGVGSVEHMDARLTALPSIPANLPAKPTRPEQARDGWFRVIAGENDHGVSGSAFVGTQGGLPIALGVVTHSFPAALSGTEEKVDEPEVAESAFFSLKEIRNIVTATIGELNGRGYSLISTFDPLASEYDPALPSATVAQMFKAAERTGFKDMSTAGRIRQGLSVSGASAVVYLRRECETPPRKEEVLLKHTFCLKILMGSVINQCLYTPDQYLDYSLVKYPTITYQNAGNAVKAANEAREILGSGSPGAAKGVVPILSAALAQSLNGKTLVGPAWDSAAIFDLAKAERAAGADTGNYLNRLRRSIEINPANTLAKRAFVDAVAQSGRTGEVKEAATYLGDLSQSKLISPSMAAEAASVLQALASPADRLQVAMLVKP